MLTRMAEFLPPHALSMGWVPQAPRLDLVQTIFLALFVAPKGLQAVGQEGLKMLVFLLSR